LGRWRGGGDRLRCSRQLLESQEIVRVGLVLGLVRGPTPCAARGAFPGKEIGYPVTNVDMRGIAWIVESGEGLPVD